MHLKTQNSENINAIHCIHWSNHINSIQTARTFTFTDSFLQTSIKSLTLASQKKKKKIPHSRLKANTFTDMSNPFKISENLHSTLPLTITYFPFPKDCLSCCLQGLAFRTRYWYFFFWVMF